MPLTAATSAAGQVLQQMILPATMDWKGVKMLTCVWLDQFSNVLPAAACCSLPLPFVCLLLPALVTA